MKKEKEKWVDIQVSRELYNKMNRNETCAVLVNPTKPKKKDTPYLEIIMTGKKPEKRFENFKKVKFPTLCIYGWNKEYLGVINCACIDRNEANRDVTYELHDISKQHNLINRMSGFKSLEEMDTRYNIREIVKAKIIVKRG